ncbi:hypothetical protein GS429_20240 [Natronorubrum sp. JWXQ-INN-674]|uniref:Uncharacterized protein n=1 Tax=Natronorubrum halalkaliphilum TaxID=2691917 RepID=A0A6B0VSB9_9EURY|nr:hypothetical protein [Natronorubrum halalkaliphilum]MXV64354.1 hypothetical protein [Natronorubrum halalkaliphilum]
MKWRCTWCGKPHEENDPPCDNCGHNKFEKAIVREGEGEQEPGTGDDTAAGTVDTGTQYMWVCDDCGRQHMRNNPPCSRCGSHDLEKIEQRYDDIDRELETPSWFEVAKPYTPIFVVIGLVVALFATGIIPLSVLPGLGEPSPPDAPGEGTEAAGIDLEATESAVHDRLEAERDVSRTYDDGLAAYAEYLNRALIAIEYEDADPEGVEPGDFGVDCQDELLHGQLPVTLTITDYDDEGALADDVVDSLRESTGGSEFGGEGLDLHVVDGSVYVFYAAC